MTSAPPPLAASIPVPTRRRSRLLGSPAGELALSVLTGEHQGRQVRIRGPKCTIGSGRGCTLRLRARGVQPLHCWILRGAGGAVVRRRHRDTQLNGRTFEDAALSPGDKLRIGSIELEVSECPAWTAAWTAEVAYPLPVYDELDRELWERTARESAESIDRLRGDMQDLERRATAQLAELNELICRVSIERDALQEQLRRSEIEAASQRDKLLLDKQELELALAAGEQETAELRTHLTTREVEIESVLITEARRVAEIQNRLEVVLRERSALEARLHDQTVSLREECIAGRAERDCLQEECERLDAQLSQLRKLVGDSTAEWDHATLHIGAAQRQQGDQHEHLHREKLDLQERLDAAELARRELEEQLRDRSAAWQAEQQQLRSQQERQSEQCLQLDGQLKHVRELVDSLASEKESLCEQLEAADLRLTAEQETFAQERSEFAQRQADTAQRLADTVQRLADTAQRLADQEAAAAAAEVRCHQLDAQLSERLAGSEVQAGEWRQQAEDYEEQIRATCEQLATATGRLAELQSEIESRREIDAVLATQRQSEAERAREELTSLQMKLADAETRLAAALAASQSHGQSEDELRKQWECRAGELQFLLSAAELRVTTAENRLTAIQSDLSSRQAEAAGRSADAKQQAAERTERLAAAEDRLATLEAD
jgi:chromosome segregation ATPase